jgi:hypothetical protein
VTGIHNGGDPLQFAVGPVVLPETIKQLSVKFKFSTWLKGEGSDKFYVVDSGESSLTF